MNNRYNKTPVIMASGRELCYVLLCGVFSCYAMSFVILSKPTVETCAVMRIGLGLCLSICYSAIFTKTNRISRIFNRGVKSIKRPVYTSPISQVAIALGSYPARILCFHFIGNKCWQSELVMNWFVIYFLSEISDIFDFCNMLGTDHESWFLQNEYQL